MLVLTRKTQQQIQIGNNITITIVRVTGQAVRVGIEAPEEVRVIRSELVGKPPKGSQPVTVADSVPAVACNTSASEAPASLAHAAPLASRCRSRILLATSASGATETQMEPTTTCLEDRRRVPGASFAPVIRRPQRLGPASLGSMCRLR
jgi:carbon storage regulator CsrA